MPRHIQPSYIRNGKREEEDKEETPTGVISGVLLMLIVGICLRIMSSFAFREAK